MKKLFLVGWLMLLLVPVLAVAQSQFDGTWKEDFSNAQWPTTPNVFLLQNGMYECKTCVPTTNIKADGTDQKITGSPYADTESVKVVDDHNVEVTLKKDGKVVRTVKVRVSADGNTMTLDWTYSGNPAGGTQTGSFIYKRVAKGPAGANLISGSWLTEKANESDANITWSFKVSGNELTMTDLIGHSYTAKLDGTDAPYKGDPGITSVSVKMLGKDTLEETQKRDGKVIIVNQLTISADGKTLKIASENKLTGRSYKYDAHKQ